MARHDDDRRTPVCSTPPHSRGTGARSRVIVAVPPDEAPRHVPWHPPRQSPSSGRAHRQREGL